MKAVVFSIMDATTNLLDQGFQIGAGIITVWVNIQWRRFMKFWIQPPYKPLTIIIFRLFFAANLIGVSWNLMESISLRGSQIPVVLKTAGIGVAMSVIFWAMVTIVEYIKLKRDETN